MHIEEDIRKLLIEPTLGGSLTEPVDEFVLLTAEGPVLLAATLTIDQPDHAYRIDVRDTEGRDLRQFFTSLNNVTETDTLNASGIIGGRVRVNFRKIWPPCRSQTRPIGDVRTSSAELNPEEIEFPPSAADSRTFQETRELLQRLNPGRQQGQPSEVEDAPVHFEHIAIFANVKLQFTNSGTEWRDAHPFWGKRSVSKSDSWDGNALDGQYSIRQSGNHLEVGFRHESGDDDEAKLQFDAFLKAIAYTHGIFPWPTFIQRRRDGRVMEQKLRLVHQIQGNIVPLRCCDGHLAPDSPTHLIGSVARFIRDLPPDKLATLTAAMWVFRGADSEVAPAPLQMAMICSVIEGIRAELFQAQDPPAAFQELRAEAIGWLDDLEAAGAAPDKIELIGRLKNRINDWTYYNRRLEWENAFVPLFPGRRQWVMDLFQLFNRHRHGPAHGSYGSITNGDPHEILEATGRLAGFVNIILAARAGYKGPIVESPFADRRISL